MARIVDGLRRWAQSRLTPKQAEIPRTVKGRAAHLLRDEKKHRGEAGAVRRVAQRLGISPRSVERYLDGSRKSPPKKIAAKLESEVRASWKPGLQKRAVKQARTGGIRVETKAKIGYTATDSRGNITSTPDPRIRMFARDMPPEYADRLFAAEAVGDEAEARRVMSEFIQEHYYREGGGNENVDVEITDIDWADFRRD